MSLIVQTIIIGLASLAALPFSVEISKSIVLIGFLIWSILLFTKGLSDIKSLRLGKDLKDATGAEVLPYGMPLVWILIAIFVVKDINAFHLLWAVNVLLLVVEGVIFSMNGHRSQKKLDGALKKTESKNS